MPPVQGASWGEWYQWILCEIYKKAGGDCKDLVGDSASRASIFIEYFENHDVPEFPSSMEQEEFVSLLNQLKAHLLLPGNDLPSGINQDLIDVINKLLDEFDK